VTGTWLVVSGSSRSTRATAMRTRSLAFSVAAGRSCEWTHEQWLRMLAISNSAGLSPAARRLSSNSGACVRGVHDETTTRFRPCSWMREVILAMLSCEQVYRLCSAWTTPGKPPA
jgi:hypothetical protein